MTRKMGAKVHPINSRKEAIKFLGGKPKQKLGPNTWLENQDGNPAVVLHWTPVVTWKTCQECAPDHRYCGDALILNSGGYETPTTKHRINAYLPTGWNLYQENYVWYVQHWSDGNGWDSKDHRWIFEDGMRIYPLTGHVAGAVNVATGLR